MRGWVASAADVEQQPGYGAEIVGQQRPVLFVDSQRTFAQRQVVVSPPDSAP